MEGGDAGIGSEECGADNSKPMRASDLHFKCLLTTFVGQERERCSANGQDIDLVQLKF